MRFTGHTDTFAEDRLPPSAEMPELRFELPELRYPQFLNAATSLLDERVAGREDARCLLAPGGLSWSYAELLATANRIAGVLVDEMGLEPGNRVLLRAPNTPMLAACW
ncbi:MAG TPA: AMP-binding protein, partial [Candidatus Cybelea sp.]